MSKKFLRDAINLVVGKQAEEIADLLDSKKHVNEFLIAKKLNLTINQTRNILYKLSEKGFVSFLRKKDRRKGWYTYFWRIETIKTLEFLMDVIHKKIEQIDYQIKSRETKDFYVCEKCGIEFNEENALLHNFTCSECGSVFSAKDNSKLIRELKKQKEKLQEELSLVEQEYKQEKEKEDKKKEKEIKKEEAIRKKALKKARKKREALKKKKKTKRKPRRIIRKKTKKVSKKKFKKKKRR